MKYNSYYLLIKSYPGENMSSPERYKNLLLRKRITQSTFIKKTTYGHLCYFLIRERIRRNILLRYLVNKLSKS